MKTQHGRDLTPAEMAEMLEEFAISHKSDVDRATFAERIVAGHRTLQQGVMRYVVSLVERFAEEKTFDARNEATIKLARKFIEGTGDLHDRFLPYV